MALLVAVAGEKLRCFKCLNAYETETERQSEGEEESLVHNTPFDVRRKNISFETIAL